MTKEILKKYKAELAIFEADTPEQQWLLMMGDLANLSESNWDFTGIRYDTVMTKAEWKEFSGHPERLQYRSKIGALNSEDYASKAFPFIVEVVKDSFEMYQNEEEGEFKKELGQMIGTLFDYSLNARYTTEEVRVADRYAGRSDEARDDGVVEVTTPQKTRFEFAISEYARFRGLKFNEVRDQIYKLCDGRPDVLRIYYYSCDLPREEREMIRNIFSIMRRDLTLSFNELQIGWEVWRVAHEIGLDTDKWLKFIGYPGVVETKKNLIDFLGNKEYAEEIIKHLEDDLPDTYAKYKENHYIDVFEVTHEEAARKQLPKSLKNEEEIKKMISECESEVYSAIPLGKRESARYLILNPVHPAATIRAFQSGTKNINGELVSVIVMTPRISPKDKYLRTLAHEVTHAVHKVILNLGERAEVLSSGAGEKVPGGVMEDFSQLVDSNFESDKSLPYKKNFKGEHFTNFMDGYITRHQAPYALVQISIREYFDQLWDSGYREPLSEKMMWDLKNEFDQKVQEWYSIGVEVRRDDMRAFDLFAPYNPDDGLVYLKRYVVKSEKSSEFSEAKEDSAPTDKPLSMPEAFKERFGDNWILDKEAKKILYWLLLETGRNHKTEEFGKIIIEKDPEECWKELLSIGLTESDL